MIKLQNSTIKVNKFFNELFGRETTRFDLLLILFGLIILTVATQKMCFGSDLSVSKKIILAFLTLDIGGGVIANFTEGTNNYYSENAKRRYLFIVIHILQPLILSWIFENNIFMILSLTVYVLISSFIITSIKQKNTQKTIAATMLLTAIILIFSLPFSQLVLQLILLIYSLKLILSFSVNWTNQS
ncbi:MAG: hypothetical protein JNM51_09375 [Bacteroidia bacterium]|nr:hypothetical protein [Bacteroidia bacterium]